MAYVETIVVDGVEYLVSARPRVAGRDATVLHAMTAATVLLSYQASGQYLQRCGLPPTAHEVLVDVLTDTRALRAGSSLRYPSLFAFPRARSIHVMNRTGTRCFDFESNWTPFHASEGAQRKHAYPFEEQRRLAGFLVLVELLQARLANAIARRSKLLQQ